MAFDKLPRQTRGTPITTRQLNQTARLPEAIGRGQFGDRRICVDGIPLVWGHPRRPCLETYVRRAHRRGDYLVLPWRNTCSGKEGEDLIYICCDGTDDLYYPSGGCISECGCVDLIQSVTLSITAIEANACTEEVCNGFLGDWVLTHAGPCLFGTAATAWYEVGVGWYASIGFGDCFVEFFFGLGNCCTPLVGVQSGGGSRCKNAEATLSFDLRDEGCCG